MISEDILRTWLCAWRANIDDCESFWIPVPVQVAWVERGWVTRERDPSTGGWAIEVTIRGSFETEAYAHELGCSLAVFAGKRR